MFQSIRFIKFLKSENDLDHYLYVITDTDFTEEVVGTVFENHRGVQARADAIIKCYSSKNLDVVKNLTAYMVSRKHNIPLLYQLKRFKRDIPGFVKYVDLVKEDLKYNYNYFIK